MPSSKGRFVNINISTLSLVKILIILATIGFLYSIRDILAILFIALMLSSALSPWVGAMETRRIPRGVGILLIYLSLVSIITLSFVLLIPPVMSEYKNLSIAFPVYTDRFMQLVQTISPDVDIMDQVRKGFQSIQSQLIPIAGGVFTKLFDIIGGIVAFFVVFVVVFYMIVEEGVIRKAIHYVTPFKYQGYIDQLIVKIQKKIGLWLRGQAILSLIIFLLSFIGLSILGVRYALILALVAGLTEFMPIIGPILGSIPAIFIAFNESPLLAFWVFLLFVVIQRLENDLLVPRVMQKTVGINPLVSIIALLIGGKIGGFFGILLAIPVATVIGVIIEDLLGNEEEIA